MEELKKLLQQGNMDAFYRTVEKLYRKNGKTDVESINAEQISKKMWFFYYVISSPIGVQELSDYNKKIPDFIDQGKDIWLKSWVFDSLLDLYHPQVVLKLKERKRNMDILLSTYASIYIRQIRTVVDHGFCDTFPTEDEVFGKQYVRGQFEARQLYSNMYVTAQNRQLSAKSSLENRETVWMNTLVEHFPGNKADILRFIRMAGYRDDEMVKLFNRTVGHGPKTDFLYKGFRKKDQN